MEGRIMTVTLSSAGGSSVPNWQLLQTATPSGVATVTFSGLSGYSKYRLVSKITVAASGTYGTWSVQINADTNISNYFAVGMQGNSGTLNAASNLTAYATFGFYTGLNSSGAYIFGNWEIDNALNTNSPKYGDVNFYSNVNAVSAINTKAIYWPTAAITSILIGNVGGTAAISGTLWLQGAN